MKASINCINLIKEFEGCKLEAYLDSVGVATIGIGSTRGVKLGQKITLQQANELLIKDMAFAENTVNRLVKSKINQNQFDALVSFVFNLGEGNFGKSTLLRKINNNPNDISIRQEFNKWVNAGGKPLNGLVRRRAKESELYFRK